MNLCDDGWWRNDVGWWCMKLCGFILCWYCDEMIWNIVKMNCGNDEMIEVDAINVGVFVSSYIYIISLITYIYENIGTITKYLIPFAMMIRRDPQSEPL